VAVGPDSLASRAEWSGGQVPDGPAWRSWPVPPSDTIQVHALKGRLNSEKLPAVVASIGEADPERVVDLGADMGIRLVEQTWRVPDGLQSGEDLLNGDRIDRRCT